MTKPWRDQKICLPSCTLSLVGGWPPISGGRRTHRPYQNLCCDLQKRKHATQAPLANLTDPVLDFSFPFSLSIILSYVVIGCFVFFAGELVVLFTVEETEFDPKIHDLKSKYASAYYIFFNDYTV